MGWASTEHSIHVEHQGITAIGPTPISVASPLSVNTLDVLSLRREFASGVVALVILFTNPITMPQRLTD